MRMIPTIRQMKDAKFYASFVKVSLLKISYIQQYGSLERTIDPLFVQCDSKDYQPEDVRMLKTWFRIIL
jgi:hypothetical protein